MQLIHYTNILVSTTACLLLGACISSPLPAGTVGALYQWDDLDTPVVTREGISSPDNGGYYDGDFGLADLPTKHPELNRAGDPPWLFEACDEKHCYSIVLFAGDYGLDPFGNFSGNAAMTALSTLMANEVRGLPASSVRPALDTLSVELTAGAAADYASFIRLDPRREQGSRDQLLYTDLYGEAVALHSAQPAATVRALLGEEVESTADLVVSSDFEFDSSWQLAVDVDLSSRFDDGAYLLLCSSYESAGDGYNVDYSSCPLSAPLQAGTWQGEVKLTGLATELIAVIMPLQNPNDAEYTIWQRSADGETLMLR